MKRAKPILLAALILLLLWSAMAGAVTLTAAIPRSAVEQQVRQAADFYETADMFEKDNGSLIHHYADAILVNILWNHDPETPFRSALDARFYQQAGLSQGQGLAAAVEGAAANTSYARYWHGMTVILKPLLCLLSMEQIKLLGAVVLALLAAAFLLLAWKRRLRVLAVSTAVGLVLIRIWIVPQCLEYYSCFALMLLFGVLILLRADRLKGDWLLFLICGALTCFFDFLTCEVVTLALPLLCLLLVRQEGGRAALFTMLRCCAAWLLAYSLTWLCKWLLSAAVLGYGLEEILQSRVGNWMAADVDLGVELGFVPLASVLMNLGLVFPMCLAAKAPGMAWIFAAVCLGILSFWYLFRREGGCGGRAWPLLLVAAIPFVRFAVVAHHSLTHAFFTYRSLLVTVAALSCAVALSVRVGRKPVGKGRK